MEYFIFIICIGLDLKINDKLDLFSTLEQELNVKITDRIKIVFFILRYFFVINFIITIQRYKKFLSISKN
jgi:hypothetical protein